MSFFWLSGRKVPGSQVRKRAIFRAAPISEMFLPRSTLLRILLVTLIITSTCFAAQPLGRVINGRVASKLHVPWLVHVVSVRHDNTISACGGSIITRNAILTAAHCVVSKKHRIKRLLVYYNTTRVLRGPFMKVTKTIIHKKYKNAFLGFDIAVLKLAKPIPRFDWFVRPVCLPGRHEKTRKGPMLLAGYGRPTFKKQGKRLLYYITKALPDVFCDAALAAEWWMFPVNRSLLMCSNSRHAIMYKGDSGSPVTAYTRQGQSTQYGIASFLRPDNSGRAPAVHTRVSMFIDWIKQSLEEEDKRREHS
ncbi:chymotrypsin-C-like isoform X2 [Dermacentor albipictus]|uniref:chymotrypsin-C-like isoform X2 n=1 Tax=Dermacentor albipictus TaxID=60249 RepID=UPI0031FC1A79